MTNRKYRVLTYCVVTALAVASALSAEDRCTVAVPAGHCMIGTWQAESTNAPERYNQAQGHSRWASQDMGENLFVFGADGSFSQETKRASTSRFEHRVGDTTQQQEVKISSKATGRWSPSGPNGLVVCKETFEMKMGDTPLPAEVSAAETTGEIPYEIDCQGDRAEVTLVMPAGPRISWTARRVSP